MSSVAGFVELDGSSGEKNTDADDLSRGKIVKPLICADMFHVINFDVLIVPCHLSIFYVLIVPCHHFLCVDMPCHKF